MDAMSICFVEDNRTSTAKVIEKLEASGLFEIHEYRDYSGINDARVNDTELFVLDVDIGGSDEAFSRFINVLRSRKKPFLAFTVSGEHATVNFLAGKPKLRDIVFEHGGLAVVSKNPEPDATGTTTHEDLCFDLLERIMSFFWGSRA